MAGSAGNAVCKTGDIKSQTRRGPLRRHCPAGGTQRAERLRQRHHKEFIIETTGNGASFLITIMTAGRTFFFPTARRYKDFPKGEAPTGHLYHNNHDGTFTDVTAKAGLARAGWGQGGCVGDYDNDGNLDLL